MWERIRRFGVELYAFFTTPFVLKNCLSMIGMMAGLLMLTFWWLKCYTNHGDSVQVPSYVGMSFREAARKARSRDFGVAVSDSLYVPGKPPGEIVAQDPKTESRVKEGRTIYFTVTKNNPDIIKLPTLAGSDDYELYSRKLSRLGLKPRIVARIPDPKLGPNIIIDVVYRGDTITRKINRGMPVEMGATIDFIEKDGQSGFKIDNPNPLWADPVALAVQKVIDDDLNPAVSSHGGVITLLDVRDDTAFIQLGGGCQGCGMADVTLKQGIEVRIRELVPSIQSVVDTTDHAEGRNPFFRPSKGGRSPYGD